MFVVWTPWPFSASLFFIEESGGGSVEQEDEHRPQCGWREAWECEAQVLPIKIALYITSNYCV